MPNPILHSDILKDDGAIDSAIAKLEALGKAGVDALDKVKKAAGQLETELEGVSIASKANKDKIDEAAKHTAQLEAEYKKLTDTLSENGKQLALLREGKTKANQIAKNEAKLTLAAEGSYNQLSAKYSLIKIRLNEMSKAQREATEEGRALVKESKEIRDEMNRLQTETGNTSLNVGNYKESIKEALGEMNSFGGVSGVVVDGVGSISKAFKALLANPIVFILSAIVAALAALGNAFARSERGAKLFEKAGAVVSAGMTILVGLVNKMADGLESLFEGGILDGLKKIGQAILDNLVNRFKGVIEYAKATGRAIKGLAELDLKALKKAGEDAATATAQIFTGLDAEQQKAVGKALSDTAKEAANLTNKYIELAEAQRKRREENISLTRSLGELQKAEAVAQVSANDTTLSFEQQLKALDQLEAAQQKRLQTEIRIARNNLSNITQELNIRKSAGEDVIGLYEEQTSALAEVQRLESEYTVNILEGAKLRREIRRDEFERSLDYAIDFYDAQKTLLEKTANDAEASFEKRVDAYNRLRDLDSSAFAEQQKLLENFTGAKLNLNELALEDDERVVRERLKQYSLDDVTLGRILETLRERKAATGDILELEQELTRERNKSTADLKPLEPFDFGKASEKETADKITKQATKALELARIQIADELERSKPPDDIYDLLGIDFGKTGETQMKSALQMAKDELLAFAAFRTQIADQNVENSNREVEEAQRALEIQMQNQSQGSASRIKAAEKELEEAKKRQAKALSEQQKAQRAERRLQTIQQAANLVTASAKIWGQLGFPAALPALAIMWGSFIASKVRAEKLAKSTNRKGTYLDLDFGDSHESGNDIPFGVSRDGKSVLTAERGESMAVFTAQARRKYGSTLPMLVDAINRNKAEIDFGKIAGEGVTGGGSQAITVNTSNGQMETHLKKIAENTGRETMAFDGKGRMIVKYKNQITKINLN